MTAPLLPKTAFPMLKNNASSAQSYVVASEKSLK
jgi:hypothetical protein